MVEGINWGHQATKLNKISPTYLPAWLRFFEELEVGLDPATDLVETGLP